MYLVVDYKEYRRFTENESTDRIGKGIKISPMYEIFNTAKETEYVKNIENHIEGTEEVLKITFLSNSKTKYRLDIFIVNEYNSLYNHIAFSLDEKKTSDTDYELPTHKNELYDVLGRINFILQDLIKNNDISNKFCIGASEDIRKNRIYQYLLKSINAVNIEKKESNIYDEGWGVYFEKEEEDIEQIDEDINTQERLKGTLRYLSNNKKLDENIKILKSKRRDIIINKLNNDKDNDNSK